MKSIAFREFSFEGWRAAELKQPLATQSAAGCKPAAIAMKTDASGELNPAALQIIGLSR